MLGQRWANAILGGQNNIQATTQAKIIQVGGRPVQWRQSIRRRRSLALRIDRQGGIIVMTPQRTSLRETRQFVESKRGWIDKQIEHAKTLSALQIEPLEKRLVWMGEVLSVHSQVGRRNRIARLPGVLNVTTRLPLNAEQLNRRLKKWLREQANEILPQRLNILSEQTGLLGSGHQIKTYTARWGSCRYDGLIQLNWKLVMAPAEVIDYVIIHELCHLKHFNHSPTFWAQVASYCPEYSQRRDWLKSEGRAFIGL